MNRLLSHRLTLLCTLTAVLLVGCRPGQNTIARQGVLDLRAWEFNRQGQITLTGEWEFYWQQFLTPQDFPQPQPAHYVFLPARWNGYKLEDNVLSGEGYATYRLTLLVNSEMPLALRMPWVETAYRLYVNGREVQTVGVVGKTAETTTPQRQPQIIQLPLQTEQIELVLQVANFHHYIGGPRRHIWLGTQTSITQSHEEALAVELFVSGTLVMMAVYHFSIFLFRKTDLAPFYLTIFCFGSALRLLLFGESFLLRLFPWLNWELAIRLDMITIALGVPLIEGFFLAIFPKYFSPKVIKATVIIGILFGLTVILAPAAISTRVAFFYQSVLFAVMLYTYYVFYFIVRDRQPGGMLLLVGTGAITTATINDILSSNQVLTTSYVAPFGISIFVFAQAFVLARHFSDAYERAEQLSVELEHRVQQRTAALQEAEMKYRTLVEQIPAVTYIDTPDQMAKAVYISPQIKPLLNYSPDEIMSHPEIWFESLHPEDYKQAMASIEHTLKNGRASLEYRLLTRDKQVVWVRDESVLVCDDKGQPQFVQGVMIDITERKRTEDALALARDEALAASELKSEMLAKVSHELRTPLGAILGYVELLQEGIYGPLVEKQKQTLQKITHNAEFLTTLVSELLDQGQLETGKLVLNCEPFELREMAEQVYSHMKTLAQAKSLTLTLDVAATVPNSLWGDETRIKQILVNLVTNAIKFTRKGSVHILIDAPTPDGWVMQVTDTGIGIPLEAQTYIFEPFRQVDGSSTREQMGYGLGLSIVKQLTTLMGGEILLESQVGKGSIFTVTLPFLQPDTPPRLHDVLV